MEIRSNGMEEKIPAKANYSENIFHPIETCKYHLDMLFCHLEHSGLRFTDIWSSKSYKKE